MLNLNWTKCGADNHWCDFENVTLDKITANGVYIIWHEGNPSRVVYVGQGDIKNRLTCHRSNKDVLAYKSAGKLRVTWAAVPSQSLDGVERYLADHWNPLAGDAHPAAPPIQVNSPF